jgi:hypothetical protein
MQKTKNKAAKPRKNSRKKTVIVTKTEISAKKTLFPKKLKKINDILSRSTLMP